MQSQIEKEFPSLPVYSVRAVFGVRLNSSCLKFQRKKNELFLCKQTSSMNWFTKSCVPCLNKRRDLLRLGVKFEMTYPSAKNF